MDRPKTYYHRNLPLWHPPGAAIFLTCRLYGSLPDRVIEELKESQRLFEREIVKASASEDEVADLKLKHYKKRFAKLDGILDRAETGRDGLVKLRSPTWWRAPSLSVAQNSTLYGRML